MFESSFTFVAKNYGKRYLCQLLWSVYYYRDNDADCERCQRIAKRLVY